MDSVQAAWRTARARRSFLQALRRHRAASAVQRVWRHKRRGSALREHLRTSLLAYVALHRAAVQTQAAWRARVGAVVNGGRGCPELCLAHPTP